MKSSCTFVLAGMATVFCAVAGIAAIEEGHAVVVKGDGCEWRFLLIDGTTMLPTEYMRTGEKREEEEEVRLAPFWIASAPITRRQFAEIMEKTLGEVPKSCFDKTDDPNAPVDSVTWVEAFEFCERFNAKHCRELPKGYLLQLPISIEWAHAVRTLEKKGKFDSPVGCMLFTRTGRGGFLRTYSDRDVNIAMRRTEMGRDYAIDYVEFPPHVRHASVGFRPILSPICGEDGKGGSLLVTRGTLLADNGFIDKAERTLKLALAKANLKGRERERAEECLEWLASKREYDYVDWSGLVDASCGFAERRGYAVRPFMYGWMEQARTPEEPAFAHEYEKNGIEGGWMRIHDLPTEARMLQHVGNATAILIHDNEEFVDVDYVISTNTLVQVLKCDFDGDGLRDMVVEEFGAVGSGGYWYNFLRKNQDGSYSNILSIQTVGLCAVPSTNGCSCAFVNITKESNPILSASLISWWDGEMLSYEANALPFCMQDAEEDSIYPHAPFIGAGYGLGWHIWQGQGKWYRPLYWPWKRGVVQGHAEATLEAAEKTKAKQAAVKRLEALRAKWPNAEDWISMWDMPDCAKRFFEIDALQDWCNEDKKARYGEFEEACREAIAMKMEPPVWYYNLACALAVQGKRDEAFDALEQAVVAGYNEVEHAKCDSDFDTISDNPRFSELLQVMGLRGRSGWQWAKKQAAITNDVVELTADNVYFVFNKHCYLADVEADDTTLFYMDRDGKDDVSLDGYVTVKYEDEAKKRNRHLGLANIVINKNPVVARGTFVPEQIRTAAVDAIAVSQQNVLGLYACENWTNKLDWCILYRGGEKEGRRLAAIVRIVYLSLPHDQVAAMLSRGEFAREMTTRIHNIVKDGKDGAVIDVADIDVSKLDVAEYTVKDGEDLTEIAIRFGIALDVLRELNGLKANEELRPGMVIRLPKYD